MSRRFHLTKTVCPAHPWLAAAFVLVSLVTVFPALAAGPTFTVTTAANTDDGACTVDDCSLREAINAANPVPMRIPLASISVAAVHRRSSRQSRCPG